MNFRNMANLAVALILILAFTFPLFAIPSVKAYATYKTYPLIDAIPNPVGVNQSVLINFGLLNYLYRETDGWNITIIITKPDNTTETFTKKTWSTGMAGFYYTPKKVGTYYVQAVFPGEWYNYTGPAYYLPSQTDKLPLIVQKDPVPSYPGHTLPSEYWTRPIDAQLREWYSIAGSWLAKPPNLFAPYNDGPESPHILWAMPIGDSMGGLAGGAVGEHSMADGDAYEGKFADSVIINGILYYNKYPSYFYSPSPQQEIVAVDLHTGKVLWSKDLKVGNRRIAFGQILYWDSRNNRGAFAYLWVIQGGGFIPTPQNWYAFDPYDGTLKFNITNVPSGTNYYGPNGEILRYFMTNIGNATHPNWRLIQWNSSYVVSKGKTGMAESWGSQVQGVTYDAKRGYDLNVSIPALATPGSTLPGSIVTVFPCDRVIGSRITQTEVNLWALSLKKGSEGQLLFNTTWKAPAAWVEGNVTVSGFQGGWGAFSQESMVGALWVKEERVNYGFSLLNGSYLWKTEPQSYADAWADTLMTMFGPDKIIAYGKLYSASVSGTVYCYDVKNGKRLWTYNMTDPYHESYITNNWWAIPLFVTDGKIYVGHCEHSALNPKPRGAPLVCLNATTGEVIWRADGLFRQTRWGGRAIIGDSIIAAMDTYDQRIYAIGKGPSSTTVSAPDVSVSAGTPIIIKGTVMDVSPGTQSDAIKLRFPKGVPAVSDESMTDWMLYVYKQFENPMTRGITVKGVQVSIDVMYPNGTSIHVGDAVSDSSGMFSYVFTPETAGMYTIYATFAGSKSYYPSYAQTVLYVTEAPPETPPPPEKPLPPYEMYTIGSAIAIIIAIAIAVFILKRK
jgi:outer membrane protein assembly factor BamB